MLYFVLLDLMILCELRWYEFFFMLSIISAWSSSRILWLVCRLGDIPELEYNQCLWAEKEEKKYSENTRLISKCVWRSINIPKVDGLFSVRWICCCLSKCSISLNSTKQSAMYWFEMPNKSLSLTLNWMTALFIARCSLVNGLAKKRNAKMYVKPSLNSCSVPAALT